MRKYWDQVAPFSHNSNITNRLDSKFQAKNWDSHTAVWRAIFENHRLKYGGLEISALMVFWIIIQKYPGGRIIRKLRVKVVNEVNIPQYLF